ncbi:MAG: Asp-tRNA(Asn)/Glu-tRNA(Gln) amidotransferase subunit GatC [Brevinematia bacterium]
MPEIGIEDVKKIAALAKLEFSPEELQDFTEQFKKIVSFIEKISELDTSNVKPMVYPVENKNITRDDVIKASAKIEDIEAIAPEFSNGCIVVPKVIEY